MCVSQAFRKRHLIISPGPYPYHVEKDQHILGTYLFSSDPRAVPSVIESCYVTLIQKTFFLNGSKTALLVPRLYHIVEWLKVIGYYFPDLRALWLPDVQFERMMVFWFCFTRPHVLNDAPTLDMPPFYLRAPPLYKCPFHFFRFVTGFQANCNWSITLG